MSTISELVPIDSVSVHHNYRETIADEVRRIADDMQENGYRSAYPILIDMHGTIIAGHHRHAAAILAGLTHVYVSKSDAVAGSTDALLEQIAENDLRHQSTIVEDGRAYLALVESGMSIDEIARRSRHSRRYVEDRCTVAGLDTVAQSLAISKGITYGLVLAEFPHDMQADLARRFSELPRSEFFAAVDKARAAWHESMNAGGMFGDGFTLESQEWDLAAAAYVTEAMREAEEKRQEELAARTIVVKDTPMGRHELAAALGVSVAAIDKRIQRGTLTPDITVSGSPIWYGSTVAEIISA